MVMLLLGGTKVQSSQHRKDIGLKQRNQNFNCRNRE